MFWKEQPIHVIDFEGSPRYGVVEYGVVTLLGGQITRTHTALCAPDAEMTAREIALHGIRPRDTVGVAPFAEHRELFFSLRRVGVFAAHHASVESGLLRRQWACPPLSEDFTDEQSSPRRKLADWGPWIDTRALYAAIYKGLESYALGELVKAFALEAELAACAALYCPPARRKAHCALYDALASALLLLRLGQEEGFRQVSLKWLADHSIARADIRAERRQRELF